MDPIAIAGMIFRLAQLGAKLKAEGGRPATDSEMDAATSRADESMDDLDAEIARREALGN